MRKVNYYTTDRESIFRRLLYLQANYYGVTIPPISSNVVSLHDTKENSVRKVVLEFENRKEIFTLTPRDYYAKAKKD